MTSLKNSIQIICFIFLVSFNSFAQNALDFDGIDDKISIPNASFYIINSDMSISFWVNAKNPSPAYPNFDGIAGFRNDLDTDFYILHLSTNTLEARFKNSSGVLFEIVYNGFSINNWHHIAMTYDGAQLKLFDNGLAVDSVPANGTISNPSESLHMGFLPFSTPDFHLNGILDDVCLWSKALSNSEVMSIYNACSQDLTDPDLELCYQFNQGIGGGNNSTITTAIDSKSGMNGSLINFALNGPTSNFVTYGKNSASNLVETACNYYTSPSGQLWTTSNIYTDTISNAIGCDSIITVDLTINTVDSSATQLSPVTLEANAIVAAYQWLDCDNGFAIIPNATNQQFTATSNGNYAVQVFQNGCLDTSACFPITSVSINEIESTLEISISPNPTSGTINIDLGTNMNGILFEIFDLSGKLISQEKHETGQLFELELDAENGIYLLNIITDKFRQTIRVEKQ